MPMPCYQAAVRRSWARELRNASIPSHLFQITVLFPWRTKKSTPGSPPNAVSSRSKSQLAADPPKGFGETQAPKVKFNRGDFYPLRYSQPGLPGPGDTVVDENPGDPPKCLSTAVLHGPDRPAGSTVVAKIRARTDDNQIFNLKVLRIEDPTSNSI